MPNDDVRQEVLALRHAVEAAPEALDALPLRYLAAWAELVKAERAAAGKLPTWPACVAMLRRRPTLKRELAAATPCAADLDAAGIDPEAGRAALDAVQAANAGLHVAARAKRARENAEAAEKAANAGEPERAEALLRAAGTVAAEADRDAAEPTTAERWAAYVAKRKAGPAGPQDGVAFKGQDWCGLVNPWLGPNAALTPGRVLLLTAGPGGGKTAVACKLAAAALDAGCAVLSWPLELGADEQLEVVMRQAGRRTASTLPAAWAELLHTPEPPDTNAETLLGRMAALASRCRTERDAGRYRHAVNGLVVVDYVQLLTLAEAGKNDAEHSKLTRAAALLVKAAARNEQALVLLSQSTKGAQREGLAYNVGAASGADLGRVAHVVLSLDRATYGCPKGGEKNVLSVWMPGIKDENGATLRPLSIDNNGARYEVRLMAKAKSRGTCFPTRGERADYWALLFDGDGVAKDVLSVAEAEKLAVRDARRDARQAKNTTDERPPLDAEDGED